MLSLALTLATAIAMGPNPGPASGQVPIKPPPKRLKQAIAKYRVSVQIVRLADDDGGRASTVTKAQAESAIARMNDLWIRNGGQIQFDLHPDSNFDSHINSTLLNSDCLIQRGYTPESIEAVTNGDLDGNGKPGEITDMDFLCDTTTSVVARSTYSARRADRIIVLSRGGRYRIRWLANEGHWDYYQAGASSSHGGVYVNMPEFITGDVLAHEVGHYMHNPHTFGTRPPNAQKATEIMSEWGSKNLSYDPSFIFDGDAHNWLAEFGLQTFDTPADPGPGLWQSEFGSACADEDSLTLHPMVGGTQVAVTLTPDRGNVMSYFGKCPNIERHFSPGQLAQAVEALEKLNRRPLIAGGSKCYATSWEPGDLASTEAELAKVLEGLARCRLFEKGGVFFGSKVYKRTGRGRKKRGFERRGRLLVHPRRERKLLDEIIRTPEVID